MIMCKKKPNKCIKLSMNRSAPADLPNCIATDLKLPLDLLAQHRALKVMYRYYTDRHSILLKHLLHLITSTSTPYGLYPILLTFFNVPCHLLRNFYVHQPHPGGTVYQTYI